MEPNPTTEQMETTLQRTRATWFSRLGDLFRRPQLTDATWTEIEDTLVAGDVGIDLAKEMMVLIRENIKRGTIHSGYEALRLLKKEFLTILELACTADPRENQQLSRPRVILVIGVNGVGKTTSAAKIANNYRMNGRSVILAAADTFRAAAVDQLRSWGQRIEVPVIAGRAGTDPASVAFDALEAAKAREVDVLIVDTAGRMHTKLNLMEELTKIRRVLQRIDSEAPHETLLVLDATIGQNGLMQARHFVEGIGCDGVFLAKMDGSSKGGIVLNVVRDFRLPVRFIGTGEGIDDLAIFDPTAFVDALFSGDLRET